MSPKAEQVRPQKQSSERKRKKKNLGGNFGFAHLDGLDEGQFSEGLLLPDLLQETGDDVKHTVPVHKRCEKQLKEKRKKMVMIEYWGAFLRGGD